MDEKQRFYDSLTINWIPSSSAGWIKKLDGLHVAPGRSLPIHVLDESVCVCSVIPIKELAGIALHSNEYLITVSYVASTHNRPYNWNMRSKHDSCIIRRTGLTNVNASNVPEKWSKQCDLWSCCHRSTFLNGRVKIINRSNYRRRQPRAAVMNLMQYIRCMWWED